MARRPNYSYEKMQRERAKAAKKEAKREAKAAAKARKAATRQSGEGEAGEEPETPATG